MVMILLLVLKSLLLTHMVLGSSSNMFSRAKRGYSLFHIPALFETVASSLSPCQMLSEVHDSVSLGPLSVLEILILIADWTKIRLSHLSKSVVCNLQNEKWS